MLPTSWFLRNKLKVNHVHVFLDQEDMELGHTQKIELMAAAHECTVALVLLSPGFRSRKCCVQELNSFMERRKHGALEVLPVLWQMKENHLTGYHEDVQKIIWLESVETDGEISFLLHRLWPKLSDKFGRKFSDRQRQNFLVEYVKEHQHEPETVTPGMSNFLRIVTDAAPPCTLS